MDRLRLEVFRNKLSSVAEEMGIVLQRTSFSPNIKERKDLSCAIFDREGRLVSQAAHIPVHLGSMSTAVREAISSVPMQEGDMVILNDPFRGGTHLPDITIVAPVFHEGEILFYVANRAHHSDVGGMSSGSMPLSRSIFHEGIVIPPVKIMVGGNLNRDILSLIKANVRTPEEREGDLSAQIMANKVGIGRLREILELYGTEVVTEMCKELMDYSERLMRSVIRTLPSGVYEFEDFLEDDGYDNRDLPIRLRLEVREDDVILDFSHSADQTPSPMNAVRSITLSAVYYAFRCLLPEEAPTNEGCFRPIEVITRKGSILDAEFPFSVAGGNVETSQRVVDVVLGALSKALPEHIPAASQGTMNNLAVGGRGFTYYETIGGGNGAWKGGEGESAVQSHMTNTMNTPVEAIEHAYPIMVREYSIRRGSGGEGTYKGGDGIVRELEFLTDVDLTLLSERRRIPPYGLFGGGAGKVGRNLLISQGKERIMPSKFTAYLKKGDRIRIETPGGGGYA